MKNMNANAFRSNRRVLLAFTPLLGFHLYPSACGHRQILLKFL